MLDASATVRRGAWAMSSRCDGGSNVKEDLMCPECRHRTPARGLLAISGDAGIRVIDAPDAPSRFRKELRHAFGL